MFLEQDGLQKLQSQHYLATMLWGPFNHYLVFFPKYIDTLQKSRICQILDYHILLGMLGLNYKRITRAKQTFICMGGWHQKYSTFAFSCHTWMSQLQCDALHSNWGKVNETTKKKCEDAEKTNLKYYIANINPECWVQFKAKIPITIWSHSTLSQYEHEY